MNSFEQLWEEYEPNHKPYALGIKPFIQAWFNRGAAEKEKEMIDFYEWFLFHDKRFINISAGLEHWKENVKK